jgi:hypothetical protein
VWRQALPTRRQCAGQLICGEARFIHQQAAHFIEHEPRKVVAGPTLFYEPLADRIEAAVAQMCRLPRNRPLMDAEKMGHLALAETVTYAQPQNKDLILRQLFQKIATGQAECLVPTPVGLCGKQQRYVILRERLNDPALAEVRDVPVLEDAD